MIMATMFHLNLIPYKFTAYRLYNGIISASEVSVILKASAIFISTRKYPINEKSSEQTTTIKSRQSRIRNKSIF